MQHCRPFLVAMRSVLVAISIGCTMGLKDRKSHQADTVPLLQAMRAEHGRAGVLRSGGKGRVVFSMTTTAHRIDHIKPALDAIISGQTRPPDAVYLSIGPEVTVPSWMGSYADNSSDGSRLQILRQSRDPGPGLKLIGAAIEENNAGRGDTVIVYGDDDQVYGSDLLKIHSERAHRDGTGREQAFGARKISAGRPEIPVLEATGSISIRASAVPSAAFKIGSTPDACKFSDDFYFANAFKKAGVELRLLDECAMDWNRMRMPQRCLQRELQAVKTIHPLSSMVLDEDGKESNRKAGDWRSQLARYALCQQALGDSK